VIEGAWKFEGHILVPVGSVERGSEGRDIIEDGGSSEDCENCEDENDS
jgi:hypothetical protein